MNRPITALFAGLEALLVVGVGIGIPLVPLTILWAFQYGLQIDWIVFWRAAVDTWLLGSGVDVTMTLNPTIAAGLGFPAAGTPFIITIAPLGFALLTVLLGARAGRRIGEVPHRMLGALTSVVTFGVLSLAVTLSALFAPARASIWQGTLLPTLCFALGVAIGAELGRRAVRPPGGSGGLSGAGGALRGWVNGWGTGIRSTVAAALRGGTAAAAIVLAVSAIAVAGLLLTSYAKIITLYEGVHAGVLGGITLTLGQLAFLPNLVIWAGSWFVGPGFAIGSGSSVTPFGTSLGPLPAIPVLGALPAQHELGWGFLGLLVPVLTGFLVGVIIRVRLVRELDPSGMNSPGLASSGLASVGRGRWLLLAGVLTGVVGGVLMGLLAWASAGAAGPGRLVDVGPSPWLVGAYAALEIGIPAIIGLLVGRTRRSD